MSFFYSVSELAVSPNNTSVPHEQRVRLQCPSTWGDQFTFYCDGKQVQSGGNDSYVIDSFQPKHRGTYSCLVGNSSDPMAKAASNDVLLEFGEFFVYWTLPTGIMKVLKGLKNI